MNRSLWILTTLVSGAAAAAQPALTIYNQEFAVVRDTVPLDLKAGLNQVRVTDVTAHLEPDSVILRDPAGKHPLQILEQNYESQPVSQPLLLSLHEGKTIEFLVERQGQPPEIVQGKIIRAPYVAHSAGLRRYGQDYYASQSARAWPSGGSNEPIIEVNGKLRFSLPGQPLFPPLADDTILKPTLDWVIETTAAASSRPSWPMSPAA